MDPGKNIPRNFGIFVEGEKIARQLLKGNNNYMLFDVFYKIPSYLTKGKNEVEVLFKSDKTTLAGRVFGIRVTKGKIE